MWFPVISGNPYTTFPVPPPIANILPSKVSAIISDLESPSKSAANGVPENPIPSGSVNEKLSALAPEIFLASIFLPLD